MGIRSELAPNSFAGQTCSYRRKKRCYHLYGYFSSMYYDRLIEHAGASFANIIQTREHTEDGLKTWKIKDYQKLFGQSWNDTGGSTERNFSNQRNEKSEKEIHIVSGPAPRHQQPFVHHTPVFSLYPNNTMYCHTQNYFQKFHWFNPFKFFEIYWPKKRFSRCNMTKQLFCGQNFCNALMPLGLEIQ